MSALLIWQILHGYNVALESHSCSIFQNSICQNMKCDNLLGFVNLVTYFKWYSKYLHIFVHSMHILQIQLHVLVMLIFQSTHLAETWYHVLVLTSHIKCDSVIVLILLLLCLRVPSFFTAIYIPTFLLYSYYLQLTTTMIKTSPAINFKLMLCLLQLSFAQLLLCEVFNMMNIKVGY